MRGDLRARLTARIAAAVLLAAVVVTRSSAQATPPRAVALPAPDATLDAELTLVSSVRALGDGRILIVDRSERKLLVADWTKNTVAQVGRTGSGPGEYAQPSTLLAMAGDSTLLPDSRNGRWLLLAGASIVATVGPDAAPVRNGARLPLGADHRGHVIFTRGMGVGAQTSPDALPRRDSVVLVRLARTTGTGDTVAVLRARPSTITIQGPRDKPTAVSIISNPLTTAELAALYPDGWIAIARFDPFLVEWIAPEGKVVRGPPLPFERIRVNEREQRAVVEREAERTGRPPRDPREIADWPDLMPPFLAESLLPAPDGRLWIRRPPTADDPVSSYDVVDRRGALVARVSPGKDVRVVGFGRSAVYTVATDEDGIQRLQRRPFPKL